MRNIQFEVPYFLVFEKNKKAASCVQRFIVYKCFWVYVNVLSDSLVPLVSFGGKTSWMMTSYRSGSCPGMRRSFLRRRWVQVKIFEFSSLSCVSCSALSQTDKHQSGRWSFHGGSRNSAEGEQTKWSLRTSSGAIFSSILPLSIFLVTLNTTDKLLECVRYSPMMV